MEAGVHAREPGVLCEISAPPSQFCFKPKNAQKKKSLKKRTQRTVYQKSEFYYVIFLSTKRFFFKEKVRL